MRWEGDNYYLKQLEEAESPQVSQRSARARRERACSEKRGTKKMLLMINSLLEGKVVEFHE